MRLHSGPAGGSFGEYICPEALPANFGMCQLGAENIEKWRMNVAIMQKTENCVES